MGHIHSKRKKKKKRSSTGDEKMEPQVKVPVAKPQDLSSISGPHTIEGKTNSLKVSSDLMS